MSSPDNPYAAPQAVVDDVAPDGPHLLVPASRWSRFWAAWVDELVVSIPSW